MTDPLPPTRSTGVKTIAVITVLAAFIAGALLGVVADRLWMRHHMAGRAPRAVMARIVSHLDATLRLTPQQHEQVVHIIDAHRGRIEAITAVTRPQIRQELDRANAEIEKVLTPDQRRRFARMRMRMHREPPPGMPPP